MPSPCIEIFSPCFARTENFGITFSGYSFGILDVVSTSGVMLCGNSYEHPYALTSISAPALVAAYELVGVRSDAAHCLIPEGFPRTLHPCKRAGIAGLS